MFHIFVGFSWCISRKVFIVGKVLVYRIKVNFRIHRHRSVYGKALFETRLKITREILDEIGVNKESTVVDIGCGRGFN